MKKPYWQADCSACGDPIVLRKGHSMVLVSEPEPWISIVVISCPYCGTECVGTDEQGIALDPCGVPVAYLPHTVNSLLEVYEFLTGQPAPRLKQLAQSDYDELLDFKLILQDCASAEQFLALL